MAIGESYRKVNYELRPAKQIERRMMVDVLMKLSTVGFQISEYVYVGFGSVFFVDYTLFHKFLGIRRMVSIEGGSNVERRVHFNKPYDFVDIYIGDFSSYVQSLQGMNEVILWLDFDNVLDSSMVRDLDSAVGYLKSNSIIIATVDSEPPGSEKDGPAEWFSHFNEVAPAEAAEFASAEAPDRIARRHISKLNQTILERRLQEACNYSGREYFPLFNFFYGDGHDMLTVGGIILDSDADRSNIRGAIDNLPFIRAQTGMEHYSIRVPNLTRKERIYLDSCMPCADGWLPEEFEMLPGEPEHYRELFKYLPAYAELLL
ncbi:MAG: hypothetical protein RH862_17245 [Leptospiraceae bacterium]